MNPTEKQARERWLAFQIVLDLAEQNALSRQEAEISNQIDLYDEQQWALKLVRSMARQTRK